MICLALLGAGYLPLIVMSFVPALAKTARSIWPILFTETVTVLSVVAAFWIGGWVLVLSLLALAFRCSFEAADVVLRRLPGLPRPYAALQIAAAVTGGVSILWLLAVPLAVVSLITLAALIAAFAGLRHGGAAPDSARGVALDLLLFPLLPLILFITAGLSGGFGAWLLVAFLLVETFDSYASLGGKLFGRTRAFPVLSPNKTVEGLLIGAAMLMLTAAVVGAILAGLPVLASGAVALFVGALTLIGDLTGSRLKRRSGVKDFPPVMPHQGGLLDIADAWIVAGAGLVAVISLTAAG